MTEAEKFLAGRRPAPPQALAAWLEAGTLGEGEPLQLLAGAALRELSLARRSPGRVRRSAYHLLAADALLTYACEAALGQAEPVPALEALLAQAASP